jgi:hypothetical protein
VKSYVRNTINFSWDKILLTSVIGLTFKGQAVQDETVKSQKNADLIHNEEEPGITLGERFARESVSTSRLV